ncbi:MAG TPA: hypothetical protein VFL08_17475 [Arthrobacter sp.]|nr:hypothetical protein [Arthrobacter sp.]
MELPGQRLRGPTGCPQRERPLDWQLFVPTAAYLVDVVGFSRKWLRDVRADQWGNGVITNISPSRGPEVTSADPRASEPRPGHARSIARPGIPREAAGLGERRLKHGGLSGS